MRDIEISFTSGDLLLSAEEKQQRLSFKMDVFGDSSLSFPIVSLNSADGAGEFFYSQPDTPDTWRSYPYQGLYADEIASLKAVIEPSLLVTPYYFSRDTIQKVTGFCEKTVESKRPLINDICGASFSETDGTLWIASEEGKLFHFWTNPLSLKESFMHDSGCIGFKADSVRQRLYLFYRDRLITKTMSGTILRTLPFSDEMDELVVTHVQAQSGTIYFSGKSSTTTSGYVFGYLNNDTPAYHFYDREVVDITSATSSAVYLASSGSLIEVFDGESFATAADLAPYTGLSISCAPNSEYCYVFVNSSKVLLSYNFLLSGIEWYKDASGFSESEEYYRITANWKHKQRNGRQIYYHSRSKLGCARDFTRHADFWHEVVLANPSRTGFVELAPPASQGKAWFSIDLSLGEHAVAVESSSSSSSPSSLSSLSSLSSISSESSSSGSSYYTPLKFAVFSDQRGWTGPGFDSANYFAGAAMSMCDVGGFDFYVTNGDQDPPANTAWTLDKYLPAGYVLYATTANHEAESPSDMTWMRNHNAGGTTLPRIVNAGPANGVETTYSFDYRNCHFVILNQYYDGLTDNHNFGTDPSYWQGDVSDALYGWLEADLNATTQEHIFVFGHEPAYPQPDEDNGVERHMTDSLNKPSTIAHRDRFWQLLRDKGVLACFNGHTHTYSCKNINGVWQINSASADGVGEYETRSTWLSVTVEPLAGTVMLQVYRRNDTNANYEITRTVFLNEIPDMSSSSSSSTSESSQSSSITVSYTSVSSESSWSSDSSFSSSSSSSPSSPSSSSPSSSSSSSTILETTSSSSLACACSAWKGSGSGVWTDGHTVAGATKNNTANCSYIYGTVCGRWNDLGPRTLYTVYVYLYKDAARTQWVGQGYTQSLDVYYNPTVVTAGTAGLSVSILIDPSWVLSGNEGADKCGSFQLYCFG